MKNTMRYTELFERNVLPITKKSKKNQQENGTESILGIKVTLWPVIDAKTRTEIPFVIMGGRGSNSNLHQIKSKSFGYGTMQIYCNGHLLTASIQMEITNLRIADSSNFQKTQDVQEKNKGTCWPNAQKILVSGKYKLALQPTKEALK